MPSTRSAALLAAISAALVAGSGPVLAQSKTLKTETGTVRVQTFAEGLSHPWGLAVLPDGSMLVTERAGRLRRVSPEGEVSDAISGVPEVDARGQGGLLDIAIDPEFAQNRLVYLSYAEPGEGGNSTAVGRGTLNQAGTELEGFHVIFSQKPKVASTMHYGSRLVFDRAGHLFITLGERSSAQFRIQAQELGSHLGKVIRINRDGSVPQDNPFAGRNGALAEIWSYGHRNSQGAALHPETGVLWMNEHGPRGGDEINIPEAGKNYGWPVVSFGKNYNGSPVGEGKSSAPGMEPPIYQWTPVIAASGMEFYTGDLFPEWRGDVFVGGLVATALVRLELDGNTVADEERIPLGARIRAVKQGLDGALYVLTDEDDGSVLRLEPGDGTSG